MPPIRYLDLFNESLATFAEDLDAAAIPIERTQAEVVLLAGEDDHLWPSARFAKELAHRLEEHGKSVKLLLHPDAGHRSLLPGETAPRSKLNAHGGTDADDAALGALAWEQLASWVDRRTGRPD